MRSPRCGSICPPGIQEPTVTRVDIDGNEIVAYAVSSSALSNEDLSWFVDNTVSKRLLAVAGCVPGHTRRRRQP